MFFSDVPGFVRWIMAPGLQAFLLCAALMPLWYLFVKMCGPIRFPGGRHKHTSPIPLWGGVIPALVFLVLVLTHRELVITSQITGMLLGIALLLVLGVFDDLYDLGWHVQFFGQASAAVLLVGGGAALEYLNSPFGGALRLDVVTISVPSGFCVASLCEVPILGALVTIAWVMLVINAVNWFDGTDGAASAVAFLALLAIAALSVRSDVLQPAVAIVASIAAGSVLGFLPINFPPAKQFLGTAGSTVFGFLVASLGVLGGAKLATLATVLALPCADMVFVLASRAKSGVPLVMPDTRHLHHWLAGRGWSRRKILGVLFLVSALGAIPAIFLGHPFKTAVLGLLFLVIFASFVFARRPLGDIRKG